MQIIFLHLSQRIILMNKNYIGYMDNDKNYMCAKIIIKLKIVVE